MQERVQELYNKAVAAFDRGEYEISIKEYESALAIEPDNIDILVNVGAVCLVKRRADQAIKYLGHALELDSQNSMALYDIGKAYMFKEDYRLAYVAFKQASELLPDDLEIKELIISSLRSLGKFKEAVRLNLEIIDQISDNGEALMQLAGDLKMLARYDEALDIYRKASDVMCNSIEPLMGIFDCQLHMKNNDKALLTLKRASMLEPNNQDIIIKQADLLIADGNLQEAIDLIGHGLETIENPAALREKYNEMVRRLPVLKKKNAPSRFVMGKSNHETEVYDILDKLYDGKIRIEMALNELDVLRQKEPSDLFIVNEFANLLFQTKQFDKAAEVYSELYMARPNEPTHRVDLAKSQAMKGDVETARETLTTAIRELGHQAELDLALVELDLLEKDFDKDSARLDVIVNEFPDDVHALFLYAYVAIRIDKLEVAESAFQKLFESVNGDEEIALWYSRLAILQGEAEKALKIWDTFDDNIDSFVEIMSRIELMVSMGDTSQIMKQLCKIGDYCPKFIEDHLMFGKAFFFANEFVSAQREFDVVLRSEPENAEALAMLALSYLLRNKMAQFNNYWQRALCADALYAVLPMMVIGRCLNFTTREKLKSVTKKFLSIISLKAPDQARLKRLFDFL